MNIILSGKETAIPKMNCSNFIFFLRNIDSEAVKAFSCKHLLLLVYDSCFFLQIFRESDL